MFPGPQNNNPQGFLPPNFSYNTPMAGVNYNPSLPNNPNANLNITSPNIVLPQANLNNYQNYPIASKAPIGPPPIIYGVPPQTIGFPQAPTAFNQPNLPQINQKFPPPPTGMPQQNLGHNFPASSMGAPPSNGPNLPISGVPPVPVSWVSQVYQPVNPGPPLMFNNPPASSNNAGPSYQPNPNVNNGINSSSSCHSISLQQESKTVNCSPKVAGILNSHNLHRDIAKKYSGDIAFQGNKFLVSSQNKSIVDQMVDELENLIKQYSFDENVTWSFLENDGSYRYYDARTKDIIEDKFQTYYPELSSPNYENYSLNVVFNVGGGSYILEFAKIGGVHRQRRKNVELDTIRAVKRGNGKDLNKDFVRNYTWKWKHEDGEFRDYEPDAIFLIEQSFIEYRTKTTDAAIICIQGCNGTTYNLDFKQQLQIKELSKFERQIKRDPPIS